MTEVLSWGRCLTERTMDEKTGRPLIRKRVKKSDVVMARQFRKEVELLVLLDGQGAPSLYDCRETADELILEEQEIQAPSFSRLKKSARKALLPEVAAILHKIHEAGYVYLDLKPEHILSDGRTVWLIDFNGVLELGSSQCLFGSQSILPPEVKAGKPVTVKADSYAFGRFLRKEGLHPLFAGRCLTKNPEKRPDVSDLNPAGPSLFLISIMIILSVFALGQWSAPQKQVQDRHTLIEASLNACEDIVCQLDILQGTDMIPAQETIREIQRQVTTEKEACRYLEYALAQSLKNIQVPVPDTWDARFAGTYTQLKEIWRKQTNDDHP